MGLALWPFGKRQIFQLCENDFVVKKFFFLGLTPLGKKQIFKFVKMTFLLSREPCSYLQGMKIFV